MMTRYAMLLPLMAVLVLTDRADAGLILNITSTSVAPGGGASIDITVKSDGTATALGQFSFDVYIDGSTTSNSPALTFVDPSVDLGYRTDTSLQTPYLFLNNSSGGPVSYSSTSGNAGFHQEVGGGDTIDINGGNDVIVSGTGSYLLARLGLLASGTAKAGDVYSIMVVATSDPTTSPTGYTGVFSSTGPTLFLPDPNNTPTVTIGTAIVPEPGSLSLSLVAVATFIASRFSSRKCSASGGR